jgi:hypothetical protein
VPSSASCWEVLALQEECGRLAQELEAGSLAPTASVPVFRCFGVPDPACGGNWTPRPHPPPNQAKQDIECLQMKKLAADSLEVPHPGPAWDLSHTSLG